MGSGPKDDTDEDVFYDSCTGPSKDFEPEDNFYDATNTFSSLTDAAAQDHTDDPKSHIHTPASVSQAHPRSWLLRYFSQNSITQLENSYHLGNYVLDRYTGERTWESMSIYVRLGMHLLFYGSYQARFLQWRQTEGFLKAESEKMGVLYDSPDSVDHIMPFIQSFGLAEAMKEMKQPDPTKYSTFNEFFGREIREDMRPIAEPNNDLAVSSPADCRLTAFQTINMAKKYWIKGYGFTIEKLLEDMNLAKLFEDGSIVIARLAPQDYHRWHSPISGKIKTIREIPGTYYTVNPQAITQAGTLDVFGENRRSVMLLERTSTGSPVVIVAVGAMLVGSIKYNPDIEVGADIRRGQCLGTFYYGGSTVIVLLPKDEMTVDEDLIRNSAEQGCETLVKVGWRVGTKR